jgi:hypothetical protein
VGANDEIYCVSDGQVWNFVVNKPGFWEWEAKVTEAGTDEAGVYIGLSNTVVMITDTTLAPVTTAITVGFYKPHSDLFFHTFMDDGTVDDTQVSAQTAWTSGQYFKLGIEYIPGATEGTINYYIDKVLYDTKSFTISGATEMFTHMGIKNEANTNNNTLAIKSFYGRQVR